MKRRKKPISGRSGFQAGVCIVDKKLRNKKMHTDGVKGPFNLNPPCLGKSIRTGQECSDTSSE